MLLELTQDQEFFRGTTAKFLAEQVPVGEIRRLGDTPAGFTAEYWRRGADLGWTSLLVSEEAGGGSISGQPVIDLTLIAYEFGRHAAPGPLVPANIVAAALSTAGTHPEVLAELLSGAAVASWCDGEPVALGSGDDGRTVVLNGDKHPVESADSARYLLVTGQNKGGLTQVLVPADAAGVSIRPLQTVDFTRRFAAVTFNNVVLPADAVVGEFGGAAAQVERQQHLALVALCAETVGAMEAGFDMAVAWAFDRYTFGRPLASYQALKHRFADMKTWLEASHAISDAAAAVVHAGSPNAGELVSAAKAYTGHYGAELLQDCVQMHGGIGLTLEHDLHLFLRRVTLNRMLCGTPAEHRQRIADYEQQREGSHER